MLSALGRDTFSETFGNLYPPADLAAFLGAAHAPAFYEQALTDPARRIWIAEAVGAAVGYALAGPCHLPHPQVTPNCGELERLYVRRDSQGSGLGARLFEQSLAWLERPGRRLWIGVWSQNEGAQRLYARYGFAKVGEYEFHVGATRDREFIMARPG
ncbi:MAG TPA: GNAT family N-acetyltransferase [Caulobacteraceae bacterium]|nr:GNAT family N-acetyltransferase [Caulobacteraceae bacterium]